MDPETKAMLKENLDLARENNTLLKRLYSIHRRAQIIKIVYWLIILGVTFGAYYFIQPYINSIFGYYSTVTDLVNPGKTQIQGSSSSVPDLNQVKDLLKQLQN